MSSMLRLARLRHDAVNRRVFTESVNPRNWTGTLRPMIGYQSTSQYVASAVSCGAVAAQPVCWKFNLRRRKTTKIEIVVTEVMKMEAATRPIPHPRPKYVYGSMHGPERQPPRRKAFRPEAIRSAKQMALARDAGQNCMDCIDNVGWPCISLAPCMSGVNFAREVLVSRAINRRRAPEARKRNYRSGLSPLRMSFSAESQGLESPLCRDKRTGSNPTSVSILNDLERDLMSIIRNVRFAEDSDHELLPVQFASEYAGSCVYEDSDDDSDECSSLSAVEDDHDVRQAESEGKEPSLIRRRVTFGKLLSERRKLFTGRSRFLDVGARLKRATNTGWQRVSSGSTPLCKRRLTTFRSLSIDALRF